MKNIIFIIDIALMLYLLYCAIRIYYIYKDARIKSIKMLEDAVKINTEAIDRLEQAKQIQLDTIGLYECARIIDCPYVTYWGNYGRNVYRITYRDGSYKHYTISDMVNEGEWEETEYVK